MSARGDRVADPGDAPICMKIENVEAQNRMNIHGGGRNIYVKLFKSPILGWVFGPSLEKSVKIQFESQPPRLSAKQGAIYNLVWLISGETVVRV